jgi:hypothetical protein
LLENRDFHGRPLARTYEASSSGTTL